MKRCLVYNESTITFVAMLLQLFLLLRHLSETVVDDDYVYIQALGLIVVVVVGLGVAVPTVFAALIKMFWVLPNIDNGVVL